MRYFAEAFHELQAQIFVRIVKGREIRGERWEIGERVEERGERDGNERTYQRETSEVLRRAPITRHLEDYWYFCYPSIYCWNISVGIIYLSYTKPPRCSNLLKFTCQLFHGKLPPTRTQINSEFEEIGLGFSWSCLTPLYSWYILSYSFILYFFLFSLSSLHILIDFQIDINFSLIFCMPCVWNLPLLFFS